MGAKVCVAHCRATFCRPKVSPLKLYFLSSRELKAAEKDLEKTEFDVAIKHNEVMFCHGSCTLFKHLHCLPSFLLTCQCHV